MSVNRVGIFLKKFFFDPKIADTNGDLGWRDVKSSVLGTVDRSREIVELGFSNISRFFAEFFRSSFLKLKGVKTIVPN